MEKMHRVLLVAVIGIMPALSMAVIPDSRLRQSAAICTAAWNAHDYEVITPMLSSEGKPIPPDKVASTLKFVRAWGIDKYHVISGHPRAITEIGGRLVSIVPLLAVLDTEKARVAYPLSLFAFSTDRGSNWLFEILRNENQQTFDVSHPELRGKLKVPPVCGGFVLSKTLNLDKLLPTEPNQPSEPTAMAVTSPAAQEPRQP